MLRLLFIVSLCFLFCSDGDANITSLTLTNGDRIPCSLVDYQLNTDVVTVRAEDGKTRRLKGAQLDDDSFRAVRDWDAIRQFNNPEKFRVYVNGPNELNSWIKYLWYRPPGKVQPGKTYEIDFERWAYELKMDNRTGYDLENIELVYNVYYNQMRMDWTVEERVTDVIVRPCRETYAILPNELSEQVMLKSVVLRDKEIMYDPYGGQWRADILEYLQADNRFLRAEFLGMALQIKLTDAQGQVHVREGRYPDELAADLVWTEPTEENVVWADDFIDEQTDISTPPTRFEEMGGADEDEDA